MECNPKFIFLKESRFRWVECQITTLKHCWNERDIKDALRDLPRGLDATYDRILENIEDDRVRARVKLVLQLVAVAMEPLSLDDIVEALAVDCESETIDPKGRIQDPSVVLKHCSNLLELYDYWTGYVQSAKLRLRFAHFSVKEYLVSPRILQSPRPSSFFAIAEQEAHRISTTICLIYLISIPDMKSDTNSFLKYSATYWHQHVKQITGKSRRELEVGLAMKLFVSPSNILIARWLSIHDPQPFGSPMFICSPIYFSSLLGLINITAALIARHADVNLRGGVYGNALQAASFGGHKEIVELLLERGAEVNMQGGEYGSALQAASYGGHKEIVELLLERGRVDSSST